MSEQPDAPAAEPAADDGEAGRIHTLDTIAEQLRELKEAVFGGKGSPGSESEPEGAPVADEVRRELARLKAAEDRKKAAAERDGKVAELEEKVKAIAEKPPREYRKITTRLWGDPE